MICVDLISKIYSFEIFICAFSLWTVYFRFETLLSFHQLS